MENNNGMFHVKFEKGHIAAVAIALVVVSGVVAGYFVLNQQGVYGYTQMYLLDAQNSADNYPQVLVANQNSTFNQQVYVANNLSDPKDPLKEWGFQLQVKIVKDTVSFPVDAAADKTIQFSRKTNESWNSEVPISINTSGTYSVVFELYSKNGEEYVFTNNYCVLHLTVVADSS